MKFALLTGANGFLGNFIYNNLVNNFIVSTLSCTTGDYIIDLGQKEPNFLEDYEIVVHAAGMAHYLPTKEYEAQKFHQVNVIGTKNLLQGLSKSALPKQFIFISSVSVYGQVSGIGFDESFPLSAIDPYGLSKINAERLVLDWCTSNNVVCTILRLPLIIGDNPPGNLGAMLKGIKKGYYFNISGGFAKKSMVLAEDVAKAIPVVAAIGGIYNLTDGYHPSFSEISNHISFQIGKGQPINIPMWLAQIAAKFGDLLGKKAPLNTDKLKKITSDLTFDDTKARNTFGWNPTLVLDSFTLTSNE